MSSLFVSVAAGFQDQFSWAGVAAAGLTANISGLGGPGNIIDHTARGLVNAVTRTVLDGGSFGDNLQAAIPDVIGQALGDRVTGQDHIWKDARAWAKIARAHSNGKRPVTSPFRF